MPYQTNADLPGNVRSKLTEADQSTFRSAFNSAMDSKGDEAAAFRIAWSAVKKDEHTFKPTAEMAAAARSALRVRDSKPESQRGMTRVGLTRANQLINRESLSLDTVRRMHSYFSRHAKDKQGSTWGDKGKGWQAWQGWGGDAGKAWAARIVEREDKADKAASDAPGLRLVEDDSHMRCSSCVHYGSGGWCDAFDFQADPDQVCNAYEGGLPVSQSVRPDTEPTFKSAFSITKSDADQRLVFGWLYVAKDLRGRVVVDHSGETIRPDELEKAAYNFVLKSRVAGNNHKKIGVGRLVECVAFTPEKRQAMGIPDGVVPDGVWVGFKIDDDETWSAVKSGELSMLSLGGKAKRRKLEKLDD